MGMKFGFIPKIYHRYKDLFNTGVLWLYLKCKCRNCKVEYKAWYKQPFILPDKCRECKSEDIIYSVTN